MSSTLIPAVSMERIYLEINKIRLCKRFKEAFLTLYQVGLLQVIFKELRAVSEDDFKVRLYGIERLSYEVPTILILAKILEKDYPINELSDYLKASNEDKRWIDNYLKTKKVVEDPHRDRYELAHIYANPMKKICLELCSINYTEDEGTSWLLSHKKLESELSFFTKQIQNRQAIITAQDLIEIGIPQEKRWDCS